MLDCLTIIDFDIKLVQGDYASFPFKIFEGKNTDIKDVYFTSKRLGIQKALIEDIENPGTWVLILEPSITSKLPACTTTFDITCTFNDNGTPLTVIHNANVTILKKENALR